MKSRHLLVAYAAMVACGVIAAVNCFVSDPTESGPQAVVEAPPPPTPDSPGVDRGESPQLSRLPAVESCTVVASDTQAPLEDLLRPQQPDETPAAYQKRINRFEVKVANFRKNVATLDQYPAYYHVKPVVNMCVFLQEYMNGRAFPVINGTRTQDRLPLELRKAFDDFHIYSDALATPFCFVVTAEQYPLLFEMLTLNEGGVQADARLDDDLMRRVKALADQTLAMLP
jgi:hypothetical protein